MRKLFLSILFILLKLTVSAQDLKIKKGGIFIDDKQVATIEKKENLVYKVSNLDSTYQVIIIHQVCDVKGYAYILIKNGDNKNQMNYDKFSPFNIEKSIVKSLMKEGFITNEGFSSLKINEFLTGPYNDLAKEYGCEDQADENELGLRKNIKILDNGVVTIDTDNKKYGYIYRNYSKDQINRTVYKYEVYNLKNERIASISESITGAWSTKANLIAKDNSSFLIGLKQLDTFTEPLSKDPNARNIILKLLFKGFKLGE